jgi:ABC-2 type transport system permease protein
LTADRVVTRRPEAEGEVYDLGYQRYAGERLGVPYAMRAIWRDSVRASLGLGRSLTSKLLPFGLIVLALAPALITIVIAGFVSSFGGDLAELELEEFTNQAYYEFAQIPLLLFAGALGPEMFCPDRRSGVLVLYLVRPITPIHYVAARWLGFFTVMLGILLFPQALVYLTQLVIADNPWSWLGDHLDILPRAMLSGAILGALLTTGALAISAFTDRRPYAAGAILGVFFLTAAVGGIMSDVLDGASADWWALVNVLGSFLEVNNWAFGDFDGELSAYVYLVEMVAVVALGWAVLWWRYRGAAS